MSFILKPARRLATVHQANGGIVKMDMRKGQKARDILRQFKISDLIEMCKKAAELYQFGNLPLGDGMQNPDEFCNMQSATTGLPEHMCRFNMSKNAFVLKPHGRDSRSPHARFAFGHSQPRLRHGGPGNYGQLPGQRSGVWLGAAFQFARRAYAVDARDPAANRTGLKTRPARTLDALPHVRSLRSSRRASRSDFHLSRRRRCAGRRCWKLATGR